MSKKITAAFLVTVFVLSTLLIAMPVQAHTTIGRPMPTVPYYAYNFDPHAPGPTGYVWPGSGVVSLSSAISPPNVGSGAPSPITWAQGSFLPPGYQSPWSLNPPGAGTSWYQLAGNAYAPFGAVLTESTGDLIFAVNFTTFSEDGFDATGDYKYSSLAIYLPPEFTPPVDWAAWDTSNIVTTITNERGGIAVWKADIKDPFAPGWWCIYINPSWWYAANQANNFQNPEVNNPREILFSGSTNHYSEWYYVRVNGMTAPAIAGKYMFKMFLDDSYPIMNAVKADGTLDTTVTGSTSFPSTMPVENYPVMLVKGEVDPGIVEGTIRYGAWNAALYNTPLQLPGRVRAVGIADDPYTGASTGRAVEARGYFNASAKGHYEVEGVAPGVYDIYASAAGYPEMKVATGVKILPGKSFHLDFLLQPGPILTGVIYSKHSFGEVKWPTIRPVTVEIYDSNEWPAAKPGYAWDMAGAAFEAQHLKSFSPINLTDSPYTSYVIGNTIFGTDPNLLAASNFPKKVAFPWEHDTVVLPAVAWVGSVATTLTKDNLGVFNGVGPAQYWWVDPLGAYTNGGGSNSFRYQFGIKGFYGAPMEYDGHVPQVYATWVNGMTAGTYYTRSWINGYVQTDVSGTYVDYPFTVAAQEWAGDINTPMDLETSSWINKTVHFHDLPGTLATSTIKGPDPGRYLIAEAYDADNVLVAMNFTWVAATEKDWTVQLNGFGMIGPQPGSPAYADGTPAGMKYFLYRYRHIRDYGIMPGTYTIRVYMRGYVQQEFEMATISLSSSPAHISNHMYRGAGINVTLYSIDWEHPRVDRPWTYGDKNNRGHYSGAGDIIKVAVINSEGTIVGWIKYWDNTARTPSGIGPVQAAGWYYPQQTVGKTSIPYNGWPIEASKLKFNGSWEIDAWGPDLEGWLVGTMYDTRYGLDGTAGKTDAQTGIFLEFYYDVCGFLVNPGRYRDGALKTKLALETDIYTLKGYTLGYVQKKDITVYAAKGSQADTKLNLAIGANITVNIKFKKEGIFTHVPYNSSARIRVWDDNGKLVATWFSSLYDSSIYAGVQTGTVALGTDTVSYAGYYQGPVGIGLGASKDSTPATTDSHDWIRDSTTELQVLLTGNYFFNELDWYVVSPKNDQWATAYGIDGYPNYQGNYRVEVDMVNMYQSKQSFPAPPGLLAGESYHIINGVEGPYDGIWKRNHLGPWEQKMVVTVPNAHLGAEASVVFELDQRGLVSGQIAGFSWSDELRPTSWATITAAGAGGTFNVYSADGYYDMYLPAGSYEFSVMESPGHAAKSSSITVSTGQTVTGYSFYLERTNIPIPEFGPVIALVAALGASLYVLRRNRKKGN